MDFKNRVKEILIIEAMAEQQVQQQQGQQIVLLLKYFVDNNPEASNEEILKMAEEKLGPVQGDNREKVLEVIQKLKETKKLPNSVYNPKKPKKPGFFRRFILGVLSPVLSLVGMGASLASMFVPQTAPLANTLKAVTGIVFPANMAISMGAQVANMRAQKRNQQQ
jgi:hypothetical protein